MKRMMAFFVVLTLVLSCASAFAQKKPAAKKATKAPAKQLPVIIEETYKNTKYSLVPYEVVFPESYTQLQAMFPSKYTFFWLVIDNRRGNETVTFNPKRGEVTLIMENNSRRLMVDLSNILKDPSVLEKVSKAFLDAYVPIEVPKDEMKSTLVVFSPFNIGDIRSALWSFPGENKAMKPKRLQPSDVKRLKLEPVGGESEKGKR